MAADNGTSKWFEVWGAALLSSLIIFLTKNDGKRLFGSK